MSSSLRMDFSVGLAGRDLGLFLFNFLEFTLLKIKSNSALNLGKFSRIYPRFLQSF